MKSNRIIYQLFILLILPLLLYSHASAVELDMDVSVTHSGTYYYQLEADTQYAFFIVSNEAAEFSATDTERILYIDQKKTDSSGTVSFSHFLNAYVPSQTVLRGAKHEGAKEVTWYFNDSGTLTVLGTGEIPCFDNAPWAAVEEDVRKLVITDSVFQIDARAFTSCVNLESIVFEGDAPAFDSNAFAGITATIYYPVWKNTWTEDVMQQYGGSVTWVSIYPLIEEGTDLEVAADETAKLHIDAEFSTFVAVSVDGKLVNASNYTVTEGSTIITFTEEYLVTLNAGDHPVTVEFQDGVAHAVITISASAAVCGDLDIDGDVDAYDLTLLARHVGGIELLYDLPMRNADVDRDGDVDAYDLTLHARYVGGIIKNWEDGLGD